MRTMSAEAGDAAAKARSATEPKKPAILVAPMRFSLIERSFPLGAQCMPGRPLGSMDIRDNRAVSANNDDAGPKTPTVPPSRDIARQIHNLPPPPPPDRARPRDLGAERSTTRPS